MCKTQKGINISLKILLEFDRDISFYDFNLKTFSADQYTIFLFVVKNQTFAMPTINAICSQIEAVGCILC